MKFGLTYFLLLLFSTALFAQKKEYAVTLIADSLKDNANAVVRLYQIDINVASQRAMTIHKKRVVTVFNQKGMQAIDAVEGYDNRSSIKNMEAIVYDAQGSEIKKIRRKDFIDQSAVGGGTLFSDARVVYLQYTPIQYPFTICFESDFSTSTTANIPSWNPMSNYFESVEKSVLNVTCPAELGLRSKAFNFEKYNVKEIEVSPRKIQYEVQNCNALSPEGLCSVYKTMPKLIMGLDSFNLEGVDGSASNWKEYGAWFSENILKGTNNLSDEAKAKILAVVGTETDPIKKAKIVYKYMQNKTRYISVQVGIGGFKPMLANDVDRLGYGDCKALSNYTRSLLEVVGVPSYYTELYGDDDLKSIDGSFTSLQGNHAILCVPNGKENIFLECTSQDVPFGYQANFTDDRDVIVIKPEGGEILHTKAYHDQDNSQKSKGIFEISPEGNFKGSLMRVSEGTQYHYKCQIEKLSTRDRELHYKNSLSNISNLKVIESKFINDKDQIQIIENMVFNGDNYGNLSGNKMIFALNAFNQYSSDVKKMRNRKSPFEVQRGFIDVDEIEVKLPVGFTVEFLPSNVALKSKFGTYTIEFTKKDNSTIVYKRLFLKNKGTYSNQEYDEFRLFNEQVSKNDNAKIVIAKM
ncbi:DUF3857 domain-containing protein [Flavobacterium faecale]|uniref:DUF3857 domain-containing protein n=1 Tax=Flavobacterium faecale TaxID=1355330 RepID=A0A2S1LC50_9FLAO|nr:DUF3857 domain-containing transglutaminase family protein [Flavobacterium faecale]AWG21291.1 DUF3857 domain-containing protein [Flavobacterium faecale]